MAACVIAILGPTASGKSEIAQEVALALGGEIVSADSMQIYKGMDIGTAKVTPEEQRVPHHLIDILDPGEPFSVQLFQKLAREKFESISQSGKVAVLCGGTGLYVQAALEDMKFPKGDQLNNPIRQKYETIASTEGSQAVWDYLNQVDPESARVIHPNNVRRVIRALEMREEGVSYARQVEQLRTLPVVVNSVRYGLQRDPSLLAKRINQRVDMMMQKGLVDEVSRLLNSGFKDALTAPQAIGYKEIVSYLEGHCSLNEAVESIKTATRRYAKRQRSWLRRDPHVTMIDADSLTVGQIVSLIQSDYSRRITM